MPPVIYILERDWNGKPPMQIGDFEWVSTVAILMKMFGGAGRWPSGN
jgi:hypothetical protein